MSTKLDLSQYLRKAPDSSAQGNLQPQKMDLSQYIRKEERPFLETEGGIGRKAGRIGAQYGKGAVEAGLFPYTAPLSLGTTLAEQIAPQEFRQNILEDIEQQESLKQTAKDWSPQDEARLESMKDLIRHPSKQEQFLEGKELPSFSPSHWIDKGFEAAGISMKPEDTVETAANWAGFIRDPRRLINLTKEGIDLASKPEQLKSLSKAIFPNLKETTRGLGAATALQMAADENLGPIGSIMAAIAGDVIGGGIPGAAKAFGQFLKQPLQSAKGLGAKAIAGATRLGNKEKLAIQQDLIKQFRDAGIQADLGSITNNNVIKALQARLSQSGLVGKALDDFKTNLTNQIVNEYKGLADKLGESRFENLSDAGIAMQEGIQKARDADLAFSRRLYESARKAAAKPEAVIGPQFLATQLENLEKKLSPGAIKSSQQKAVLDAIEKLKGDIYDPSGKMKAARVEDLINDKIALNDLIDYEVQGGAKQLLKGLVGELDKSIRQYGRQNPQFEKDWVNANAQFAKHAATYRNKDIAAILKGERPENLMNRMNSPQGIKRVEKALSKTDEGKHLFNALKRSKLEQIVLNNMIDGATNQIKLGKFSNILEKGKNREIVQSLLGAENFGRLERLQKSTGMLAESAQKFFNASKSGSTAIDAAIGAKVLFDFGNLLMGNPWPIVKTGGGIAITRMLANYITDPVFLKNVEEGILAGKANRIGSLKDYLGYALAPIITDLSNPVREATPFQRHLDLSQSPLALSLQKMKGAGIKPQAKAQGAKINPSNITEVNPVYGKAEPYEYLKEPPSFLDIEQIDKINPPASKLQAYKNSWDRYFPKELKEKYYQKYNKEAFSEEGKSNKVGTLGDLLTDKTSRKLLGPVLNTPVYKNIVGNDLSIFGGFDAPVGVIYIRPGLSPEKLYDVLHHEGWHALQYFKGKVVRDFWKPSGGRFPTQNYPKRNYPKPEDSMEEYFQQPYEIAARKAERAAIRRKGIPQRQAETRKTAEVGQEALNVPRLKLSDILISD